MADPVNFYDPTQAQMPGTDVQRQIAQLLMQQGRAPMQAAQAPAQGGGWAGTLAGGLASGMNNFRVNDAARAFRILNGG